MVKLAIHSRSHELSPETQYLNKKAISPLCGIVQEIGYLRRSSRCPKVILTGADLTGVHVLLNKTHPGWGGYHVGAAGINLNDTLIKTLGESVERYAQLVSALSNRFSTKFCSYKELVQFEGDAVLSEDRLNLFGQHQYKQPDFPLTSYEGQHLDWIKLPSLLSTYSMWVPTQSVLIGYQINYRQNEPRVSVAVTTGTAAHTDKTKALINAVLELIQIDSAMGHWYSGRRAMRIIFDHRTRHLESVLMQHGKVDLSKFSFHWLENPDLAGFSVACVYRDSNTIPKISIGLGADVLLTRAMFKAYLEAVGVVGLSRMIILQNQITYSDHSYFYDLDKNVGYYALGHHYSFIDNKFPLDQGILATHLPPDLEGSDEKKLSFIVASFKSSNKELLFCDLTCVEAADLGFTVPRVWSPDTLSLCLPSAPWIKHPRYLDYGGVAHELPHPYP